ncbi:MAG: Glu/Leu/Phe/Val dehydrogenase [Firmicutes bacterium]|nr:Glu/Leu/Phe/Val dehydrogenase [Bacillota bacterium]HXL03482.1 Glu/Leu/Phe/Val dehydrogenase dimerization domain-containing protein [Bacillota bacterium]
MRVFDELSKYGYEQLVFANDEVSGLRAVIAIHDTTLGPALGGCRMWPYESEEEAVIDALRLARGMTYKSAAAGLNLGGGKAVIIGDPRKDKSEALLRAFGRFVDTLGGRYITAEDVGIRGEDVEIIHMETGYVVGLPSGPGAGGDPSPVTAYGVIRGIIACLEEVFGDGSLSGRSVAVQGIGNVGYSIVKYLAKEGAKVYVADVFQERVDAVVEEFGVEPVSPDEIYDTECDVFCPCALGGVINGETVTRLRCKIVAGSANNQLRDESHGDALEDLGILYAPDYIINAGGVINVAEELYGYDRERALRKAGYVYDRIKSVIEIAKREGISPHLAASRLAEERIGKIGGIHRIYVPRHAVCRRAVT